MKKNNPQSQTQKKPEQDQHFRKRTEVQGQNPKANDDPSHDQNNDENRTP